MRVASVLYAVKDASGSKEKIRLLQEHDSTAGAGAVQESPVHGGEPQRQPRQGGRRHLGRGAVHAGSARADQRLEAGEQPSPLHALGADVITYSIGAGAFIGGALEGAVIQKRDSLNQAYYDDAGVTPEAIVLEGRHQNVKADRLRSTLAAIQ